MGFVILADYWEKIKESEKIDKYLDLAREIKKAMEHEDDNDTNWSWCLWNGPQRPGKKTGGSGNLRKNWDNPNSSIVKIG